MMAVFKGFGFLPQGLALLFRNRRLFLLSLIPLLVNLLLLAATVVLVVWLSSHWLVIALPEVWWATLLVALVISAATVLTLFLGIILFVTVSSVIGAPFYEAISGRVDASFGGREFDRPWWQEIRASLNNSLKKLVWLIVIQLILLLLFLFPAVGAVAYTIIGFVVMTMFLSLEFLDFIFDRRSNSFVDRVRWCRQHKWYVLGFGIAIFIGLAIPIVNLFVPPAAAAGAVLLYHKS